MSCKAECSWLCQPSFAGMHALRCTCVFAKLPVNKACGGSTVCIVLQVKLVDAGFVWTEPHSRRIKVKLTVQAEVMNGAILQQTFVVEYVVEPHMCMDCTRANTNTSIWTACAQVLQGFPVCSIFGAGLVVLSLTQQKSTCMRRL